MELGVLGPLQVRQYGLPVAIPGAKPRAILTMLGLHGGSVVSADALVALLWGDEPPRTATKALQTHISSLRRALGDGFVLTEGTGWTLSTTEIDAVHYKTAAKLGRKALTAGDPTRAVALFDQALALWRGLPELPDSARGSSEKTRWLEGHAALVEDRADALLATGRAAEIVGELESAIAEAPLRERRWGHLMLALYRAGRQGEALGAYKRARSLLAEELGVDPGPELRRLEGAIVAQDASLEVPQSQQLSTVTRAVTFLLTDIEGSTAAWEADADAMAVALARHDEIVEQVVTSRGGRLIKTRGEGDATFSVFDRPSAAAAAAIELQEAIGHEAWQLADPMRIRVALHTGEVEFRDGDYFGRAVNRAARLRSLAAGGQILCSGATAELVIDSLPDDVVLADLGTRRLRNLPRPEHVFELRLESVSVSAPPALDTPMERPALPAVLVGPGPFVGRGRELERLVAAWQSTLAAGTRAVLIAGEPGVGKTRLAGEWSRNAYDQGAVVLYGRCDEDLGAPYQPFAEALRAFVSGVDSNRLRNVRGIEALLPLIPGLADKLPDVAAPPRADPDTERYALFDAVVALLGAASATAPVVLILDDLHWAAKPTLLLLRHLLRFGEEARVQIVGTYRSTDLDRSHPLAAMLADLHRDGTATRLQLAGLDEGDVTAYVAEAGYDDEELGRALATVTGGNPFFLIEALRHVEESGGRWDPSTLPQGVREAVSRRLSRLSAETNKALAAAAVVGSRFAVTLVEQVVGEDLVDAFDEARKAGIVIEEPGGRYRFNHALVRQSLLAELPSVRRMRLHQRIAGTLEAEPGSDDELLAELAYHYFECAWAGNAAKAVEYCRRAADQAMSRVAYEGAAELYDRALHALEELDEELPDRDELQAELLIAHCEALLAAGDVTSAKHAVAQLRDVPVDSGRLGAWGVCFDGELSMLTDPERLDEIETAVSVAAEQLAALDDAAGEAKAHTVRAGCLARLGRIGDCETALDQALTAARRAHEHSRVNAVLAGAPLAALWGPNPVPRAGGRCLDVVRLLRITTGSPLVEATSTRCQAVLDAFRGRAAEGRRLIESARRTLTELGLRHALLEVDQFAGIIELVSDDAAAAEPYLRRAYEGFRRMGLDTDTADTAALLARACLALERDAEADELCSVSERLAGHGSKASIAWRSVRAQLLARAGDHDRAEEVAKEAVSRAAATDALVDHGDACLALATVMRIAGNTAGMRAAAEQAVALYDRKGAAALTERARKILGSHDAPRPNEVERPAAELTNECVEVGQRVVSAIQRKAWDEFESLFVPGTAVESRRRIVGFTLDDLPGGDWVHHSRRIFEASGNVRVTQSVIAVRGERLALSRLLVGSTDVSPGAPQDEFLQIYGIDDSGRVSLQVWFDADDLDAAIAELDTIHARAGADYERMPLQNAASRADDRFNAVCARKQWEQCSSLIAEDVRIEDRRRGLHTEFRGRAKLLAESQTIGDLGTESVTTQVLAVRGERLALLRALFLGQDTRPDGFRTEMLRVVEVDAHERILAIVVFDADDLAAAITELDARYSAGEAEPHAQTWSTVTELTAAFNRNDFSAVNCPSTDHRRLTRYAPGDLTRATLTQREFTPNLTTYIEVVHRLSERGAVIAHRSHGVAREGFEAEWRVINILLIDGHQLQRYELFDETDVDAALARFDQLSSPPTRVENAASRAHQRMQGYFANHDWDAAGDLMAEDITVDDRRRVVNTEVRRGREATMASMQAGAGLGARTIGSVVLATRGERLALLRTRYSGGGAQPEGYYAEDLSLVAISADGRICAAVIFDIDDFEAAIAELETRYVAGEAAPCARTWSVIAKGYAGLNHNQLAPTIPGWVNVDRRRFAPIAAGRLGAYIRVNQDETPDVSIYAEAVHRISELGAVVTRAVTGTSREGFYAEWREIDLLTVKGELLSRCEIFDEADLDVALAEFNGLSQSNPRLKNAASQAAERFRTFFVQRDWDALKVLLTDESLVEDRRQVVSSPLLRGRDDEIANLQAMADIGVTTVSSTVIALRGGRLALSRTRFSGADDFHADVLDVVEIDNEGRLVGYVCLDPDDFDAAFEELEARYMAGETASHARTWSMVGGVFASLARHEVPASTPNWQAMDHRRGTPLNYTDLRSVVAAIWDVTPDLQSHIEAVHRLGDHAALFTQVSHGTTAEGFPAEWRIVNLMTFDRSSASGCELFDEENLPAAIARFESLNRPQTQLENAASRAAEQFLAHFQADDWKAMQESFAENYFLDDRRRIISSGIRHGRDHAIEDVRAVVDVGLWAKLSMSTMATRGGRLVLLHLHAAGPDPGASQSDLLQVVEVDDDGRFSAVVVFDVNDIDAAFDELERRYLSGEAAAHAQAWSVIAGAYAAVLRHELPSTAPDWVNLDHRRVTSFAPNELVPFLEATWDVLESDIQIYVEAVHRLTDIGAVVTRVIKGTSREGFTAEWREIGLSTVDGDSINRSELFDEADIGAALARFDELNQPAVLTNTASEITDRYCATFGARDWAAMAETLADDVIADDRRRVVNAGVRHGRNVQLADSRAAAEVGGGQHVASTVLATRGERLVLSRVRTTNSNTPPGEVGAQMLGIVEIDADDRIAVTVCFDEEDVDAAFRELDARYLAGEAAAYAQTWSVISETFAAVSRGELPAVTPDCITLDHRHAVAFAPGELGSYTRAAHSSTADLRAHVEAVYRLDEHGAVVSYVAKGTSAQGFQAEWRGVSLSTVDKGLVNRNELFDEVDLDAALARFDELNRPAVPILENMASRAVDRFQTCFAARDWDAMAEVLADDVAAVDHRPVMGAGLRFGRALNIGDWQSVAEVGFTSITSTVIAIRGERLTLGRFLISTGDDTYHNDVLGIVETDASNRASTCLMFDVSDMDAALEELESRYLAGEAAAYARTWSVIVDVFSAVNTHKLPEFAPNWVNVDHRRSVAFAPGEMASYTNAAQADMPDAALYIEAVHQLNDLGAVVTYVARGTSTEGLQAERREVSLSTVNGGRVNRSELFDLADLDDALARFDELTRPAPRPVNAAYRMVERLWSRFDERDWTAIGELLAADIYAEDRRRIVNDGMRRGREAFVANMRAVAEVGTGDITSTLVATRGERLVLARIRSERFHTDVLNLVELDAGQQVMASTVVFDVEDWDVAFVELEKRYLAGEASGSAHTWSVIARGYAAANRGELASTSSTVVNIDHRRLPMINSGGLIPYLRDTFDKLANISTHVEAVHRVTPTGAVVTHVGSGTSPDGFDAEWRMINVLVVEGDVISRSELFDESDLDAALARFDELTAAAQKPTNAASRAADRFCECFGARDWDGMADTLAENVQTDDNRPLVGVGRRQGPRLNVADWQAVAGVGTRTLTSTVIALRGDRLALNRFRTSGRDQRPEAFHTEILAVVESDADGRIAACVMFDRDAIDAALQELDVRFGAGEGAPHRRTWTVLAKAFAAFNRHELPATTPDWVNTDHRSGTPIAPGQLFPYVRTSWELAPDITNYIEVVHRLADFGAVVTRVATGTSQDGFSAEWRVITLATFDGDLLSRVELFDETDLDAAIARFEGLNRLSARLTNTVTRLDERFRALFTKRDWNAMSQLLVDDLYHDDRRRVVGTGVLRGRDAGIENLRATADMGTTTLASTVLATRGQHLALTRVLLRGRNTRPDTYRTEALVLIESRTDDRIAAFVILDADDLDAAFAELDAHYLAGEAARYAQVWSGIADAYAKFNRHEVPGLSNWVTTDHRVRETFAGDDLLAYVRSGWDVTPNNKMYLECVHRLSDRGAVITHTAYGNSPDDFYAEWRMVALLTMSGPGGMNRCDLFEEADLDTAIAKFDELSGPARRPENEATRALARAWACFEARDWDATQLVMTEDFTSYDRRQVVNAGVRRGRITHIENMQSVGEVGFKNAGSVVIATRGEHLALCQSRFAADEMPRDEIAAEALMIVETDATNRLVSNTVFDLDDVDAAFAELDAKYAAGEAAACARTWTVVTQGYTALNRHEQFDRSWAFADHRKGTPFASTASAAAAHPDVWDVTPDLNAHIETVHRLSDTAVLVTSVVGATSHDGFQAEWRFLQLLTFAGESVERCELYDEDDLDFALARLDELDRSSPRLDNPAVRLRINVADAYNRRDTETFTAGAVGRYEDRRRGLRDEGLTDVKYAHAVLSETPTSWKVEVEAVAIRGDRLALTREAFLDYDDPTRPITVELVVLTDVADKQEDLQTIFFDPEDTDAAYAELETRYLAGEAVTFSRTWSAIAESYAMVNRREVPGTTPAWVDHRLVATIEADDLIANLRASWEIAPDIRFRIAAVHKLTGAGAVIHHVVEGHSEEGFPFEYQELAVVTVHGDRPDRFEMFDENDLDAAFARFDELSQESRIENAATRAWASVADAFNRRDLNGYLNLVSADRQIDDRRKGLQAVIAGPDQRAHVNLLFELAPRGSQMEVEPIAVRGTRLALVRTCWLDGTLSERPVTNELLAVTELGAEGLVDLIVAFDPDDITRALRELDSLYVAGEAAPYAHTWSLVIHTYDAFNRHELSSTTKGWVNIDHRPVVAAPGDVHAYVRESWQLASDISTRIEAVHRLTDIGAVFTHAETGTSRDGFTAEWREVTLLAFEGDAINRCEIFDEDDLDTALARFDELSRSTTRVENKATQLWERLADAFNHHDIDAFLALTSPNGCIDDRRKGLQAIHGPADRRKAAEALFESPLTWRTEIEQVATRGARLALARQIYRDTADESRPVTVDLLTVVEINVDDLMGDFVNFDCDDVDAAIEELETRYLAGEAAAHARTWSAIVDGYATFNRRELFRTTPDWVNIDHRRGGTSFGPGEQIDFVNATWDVVPKIHAHAEVVHRLDTLGAVVTQVVKATSHAGFDGEWRELVLLLIDGDAISRCEMFDEVEIHSALIRFEEINRPAGRLANAATRARANLSNAFNRRDLEGFCSFAAPDAHYEDRRKGLRDQGLIRQEFAPSMFSEAPASWQWTDEPVAIRGQRLVLCRDLFRERGTPDEPITVEGLSVTEVGDDGLICHSMFFDAEDLDAAMRELHARWIASGEVEHPEVIEAARHLAEVTNRHDWDELLALGEGAAYANHRQLSSPDIRSVADHMASIRAMASLVPDFWIEHSQVLMHSPARVLSDVVLKGTSTDGFAVELPLVMLTGFDSGRLTRLEVFDAEDRNQALLRFEELDAD
nr:BTAD domain-containing putative transcriptional regulator [Mycobacterium sp. 1164985.4]